MITPRTTRRVYKHFSYRNEGFSVMKTLMETKSQKELAFLYDLYIGTDWAERFAALVDEHVELPKKGRALDVAAGTGGDALALKERDEDLSPLCIEANSGCLEI